MTETVREQHIQSLVEHWVVDSADLEAVYLFDRSGSTDPERDVLLLQITELTPPSPGAVVAYGFYPSRDFPFPLSLAQVTPAEWEAIQQGRLALPRGWATLTQRRLVGTVALAS